MKTILLLLLLGSSSFAQGGNPVVAKLDAATAKKTKSLNPAYLVFSPKLKSKPVPVLIYLHGAGGVGADIRKVRGQANAVWNGVRKFAKTPCIVVAPQCSKKVRAGGGWIPGDLNLLLAHLKTTLKFDQKRIYLTGNSMGGYGTWVWGGTNPEHFAAIAPISGGIGPGGPKDVTPHVDRWARTSRRSPSMHSRAPRTG